jgi:phosphate transport system permease protein
MILPIMAAIARDALRAVPFDMRQAAYSLGATRWEALLGVQIPIAAPGIIAGIILALGRALGETMAVTMLIGNARSVSLSVFSPGSTITSLLANQFTAAKQDQLPALMYATLVLFSLTLVVNLAAKIIQRVLNRRVMPTSAKPHQKLHHGKTSASEESSVLGWTKDPGQIAAALPIDTPGTVSTQQSNLRVPATRDCSRRLTWRSLLSHSLTGLAGFTTAIAIVPLVAVLGYVIVNGVQYLNWQLLTQLPPPPLLPGGGIGNAIVGTLITVSIAILVSVPIGVLAALALSEVIPNSRFAAIVSFSADLLSGVPAIVIGMVVYGTIVLLTRTFSALAAGIALGILVVPTILQTATVALRSISEEVRWAALAIGATKTQTSLQIVLPAALPGIATGVVLAISRAAGETAPVLFTALFSQFWFQPHLGLLQPIATLSVLIYTFATVPYPNLQALAWAASFVLVVLALLSTILTRCLYRSKHQS